MKLICAQIDLARQKENIPFIKSYIDFAFENGYNAMLCYLENAVRTSETEYFDKDDTYSLDEMHELVKYGDEKGVSLIPVFENLGHMEKFFAYPQLENLSECENEQKEGRGFSAALRGTCGCSSNEKLYEFFEKYISEVSSVFTSPYIHMGLDEPFDFAVCPRCRERIKGGESKAQMFLKHILRSYDLVKKLGKTMMMWDDFFEYADILRELPRDIILCNWNYYFIGDLPVGHWTGRIKKDWFYLYDKLGFKYLFCAYMGDYSSAYNVKALTRYAMKYNPMGAVATSWEKSASFYLCTYPVMAAAGRLWSGRITENDFRTVYEEITGSGAVAGKLLLADVPMYHSAYISTAMAEADFFVKNQFRDLLASVIETLRSEREKAKNAADGLKNDVCADLFRSFAELYAKTITEKATDELFFVYGGGRACAAGKAAVKSGLSDIDRAKKLYLISEEISSYLKEKYRSGIVPRKDYVEKYVNLYKTLDDIRVSIERADKSGVLYCDFMMHDGFGTPNARIKVKFAGEDEKILYSGGIKPSYTGFECGGVYTLMFLLGNTEKQIEYIVFSSAGEGQTFPLNFRLTLNGKNYAAAKAEKLCGEVYFENNVIYPDTRFAVLGCGDGEAHFNDVDLGKKENAVKIKFEEIK